AGVGAGAEVPVAYDPMIARLVTGGATRDEALARLEDALARTTVSGVVTNLPFLRWLVAHPAVQAGETTTRFLEEHPPLSRPYRVPTPWTGYWRAGRDPREEPPLLLPPPRVESAGHAPGAETEQSAVTAPMPGVVLRVLAREGEHVEARQPLVVLEAMKM